MFCALDEKENIIAYHERKKVVESYIDNINRCHGIILTIQKYKKEKEISKNLPDLYLVRYADTYVQTGYFLYMQLLSDQIDYDHEYARDILLRILEVSSLKKKDKKILEGAVKVLDKIIQEDREYTPSLDDLKSIKLDYDPYFYNAGVYDM